MGLATTLTRVDSVRVIELSGRVSMMDSRLTELIEVLIDRGERYFVLNLAKVSYMDNFGIGQLCLMYTIARNRGGDLKLLKPTPWIKQLLSTTRLDTIFESFDSEADAIRSLPVLTAAASA
jgi:anti-sigma B factor antagonist